MGQCYFVDAELSYKDKRGAEDALDGFLKGILESGGRLDAPAGYVPGAGTAGMDVLMRALLTDRGCRKTGENMYQAEFDATYSWETVMYDAFRAMAPYLADAACMDIYPDSGAVRLIAGEMRGRAGA